MYLFLNYQQSTLNLYFIERISYYEVLLRTWARPSEDQIHTLWGRESWLRERSFRPHAVWTRVRPEAGPQSGLRVAQSQVLSEARVRPHCGQETNLSVDRSHSSVWTGQASLWVGVRPEHTAESGLSVDQSRRQSVWTRVWPQGGPGSGLSVHQGQAWVCTRVGALRVHQIQGSECDQSQAWVCTRVWPHGGAESGLSQDQTVGLIPPQRPVGACPHSIWGGIPSLFGLQGAFLPLYRGVFFDVSHWHLTSWLQQGSAAAASFGLKWSFTPLEKHQLPAQRPLHLLPQIPLRDKNPKNLHWEAEGEGLSPVASGWHGLVDRT